MKKVKFNGLIHSSSGNSMLHIRNKMLEVSNMNTYQDGISIETPVTRKWEVYLKPMMVGYTAVFGITFNSKRGELYKTISQLVITYSPDGKYAYILLNIFNHQYPIIVMGWRSGKEVYRKELPLSLVKDRWFTAVIFRIFDKPLLITEAGYSQYASETTSIEKSIGIKGWVCKTHKEDDSSLSPFDNLVEIDRLCFYQESISDSKLETDGNKVNQIVMTGQNVNLHILNKHPA